MKVKHFVSAARPYPTLFYSNTTQCISGSWMKTIHSFFSFFLSFKIPFFLFTIFFFFSPLIQQMSIGHHQDRHIPGLMELCYIRSMIETNWILSPDIYVNASLFGFFLNNWHLNIFLKSSSKNILCQDTKQQKWKQNTHSKPQYFSCIITLISLEDFCMTAKARE